MPQAVRNDEHLAEDCPDRYCPRFPCVMYRRGFEAGHRRGYDEGYQRGYADGYAAGYAAGCADKG